MVGCEVALGDWQQFTSEEQRLIVYASFYGLQAPEKVPYQKGFRLMLEDHDVILPDIEFEYHSQYLTMNSYKLDKEEGEPEPVITPPPPSAPELEDPITFGPKVTGIWDHLLGLMTDEQKAQLKEQAKTEDVSPSCRHVGPVEKETSPRSEGVQSRGPSRSNPLFLGKIAMAANRIKAFPQFEDVQNTILPCGEKEAVALFSSPPWIRRVTLCTTHEEVIDVFRLYHQQCWSEESQGVTDPIIWTERWKARYKKIRKRLKYLDKFVTTHNTFPTVFEEGLEFSSEDEPVSVVQPPLPKYRAVVPGDFVLTFNVLVLANSLESKFPYRSEYWWTQLPGNLDQACMCFSMQQWVEQLQTCQDEDSFLTTYQSFLDTTWQAAQERSQATGTFPYALPTQEELYTAYYMKNCTLLVHNDMVWGPGADQDRPKVSTVHEGSQPKSSSGGTLILLSGGASGGGAPSGGNDGDDPNKKSSDTPPVKGDESQDPDKTKEDKEASTQEPEKTSAEKEAQDKIDKLERQLQEAREDADRVRKAADDKARQTGEELVKQVDDEKAKKDREREASK